MKRTLLLLTLVVAMVCSSLSLHAQNDVGLTITFRNEPLVSVFQRLEGATPYKFLFNYDEVSKYNVTLSVNNTRVRDKKSIKKVGNLTNILYLYG